MSSQINNISLYIPHVFANYSKEFMVEIFEKLCIGKVNHIDFISKQGKNNQNVYNAAYIHFDYWFNNQIALNFQKRVLNSEKEARLVYEDPWYWIVLENKSNKTNPSARKIRINIQDLKNIEEKNTISTNLISDFDEEAAMMECEKEMDTIKEEESYISNFDSRYVETLENENILLRNQVYQYQNAFSIEQIKCNTLSECIVKLQNK
jgi:hypothetical protein